MRLKINPDNSTEMWGTFDGREPTVDDHDFGADFYFMGNEPEVAKAAAEIVDRINGSLVT